MSQLRKDAQAVADLLERTYVPRFPRVSRGEHCAYTAIRTVTRSAFTLNDRAQALVDVLVERYGSVTDWSDSSGKEEVVAAFRKIAREDTREETPC
ncbi:MAG: DUF6197 family protein [Egibacteraceae bacterium]